VLDEDLRAEIEQTIATGAISKNQFRALHEQLIEAFPSGP
jgi:hypothetical protein